MILSIIGHVSMTADKTESLTIVLVVPYTLPTIFYLTAILSILNMARRIGKINLFLIRIIQNRLEEVNFHL